MKKSLYLMLAGSAAMFMACGDDSSSSSLTYEQSGSIVVDPQNKTVVTTVSMVEDMCVNENNTYNWREVNLGDDKDYLKYDFKGDTLIIFQECSSSFSYCSEYGMMFVGGKAGSLDGSWESTNCKYSSYDKESYCYVSCSDVPGGKLTEEEAERMYESGQIQSWDDLEKNPTLLARLNCLDEEDMSEMPQVDLEISGSSFTAKVKYSVKSETEFDDYTNSRFMTSLLDDLRRGSIDIPDASRLFKEDSADMKDLIFTLKDYGIELASQSKTSISFKYKNETLSIKFGDVDYGEDNGSLSMTISTDKKSCSLDAESGKVTKSTCKAEYGEFFSKETEEDAAGNRFTVAYAYSKSNERDFERCAEALLDTLFAKGTPSKNIVTNDCSDLYETVENVCNNAASYEDMEVCADLQDEYFSCINSSYSVYGALAKVAPEGAKKEKKQFIQDARKLARKLQRASK